MKNVQKIDLGLTGYDELFANDEERKVNKLPRIFDIPISEIDDFPDHPFKVKIDEDMDQLVQSNIVLGGEHAGFNLLGFVRFEPRRLEHKGVDEIDDCLR